MQNKRAGAERIKMLPQEVVLEDRLLDREMEAKALVLMELRWHWTLDESNAERVSLREYAGAVGRNESVIRRDAKAYVLVAHGTVRTPGEAREKAHMGVETQVATEAVAQARGVGLQQARKTRPTEVRRVREIARQRAEDKGTSVEEEAPKVAEWIVQSEEAGNAEIERKKERLGLRYIAVEGHLAKAQKALLAALSESHSVEWGDEERELLTDTLENVRALLNLVDLALVGSADVDWDAELAALTKG